MPLYSKYTKLNESDLATIIQQFCLDRTKSIAERREIIHALKVPSSVQNLADGEGKALLEAFYSKPLAMQMSINLYARIKALLEPRTTKHLLWEYGLNHEGICKKIVLVWILAQGKRHEPSSAHPLERFYRASSTRVRELPKTPLGPDDLSTRTAAWLHALKREGLLPQGVESQFYIWTCEQVLPFRLVCIYCLLFDSFIVKIIHIIKEMLKQESSNIGIVIVSMDLAHAVGMCVRVRAMYISISFFDPDSPMAELKASLSFPDESNWGEKIHQLLISSGFKDTIEHNVDITFFVFDIDDERKLALSSSLSVLASSQKVQEGCEDSPFLSIRLQWMSAILTCGGGIGEYVLMFKRIMMNPSPLKPEELMHHFRGRSEFTFASIAAQNNCVEIINALIEGGLTPTQINAPLDNGITPVYIAAVSGHSEIITRLREMGLLIPEQLKK